MDYRDRHVVVTGGTGALGTAVVSALLAEGATCHVPTIDKAEVARFAHRKHARVRLVEVATLADDAQVARFYEAVPQLWASIHIAGGFAMHPLAETGKTALMAQLEMNLVSCYLCCAAAVRAMKGAGGRIVNVAARPALEPRLGAGMTAYTVSKAGVAALTTPLGPALALARLGAGMTAYTVSKAGVAALTQALGQEVSADGILVNAVAPSILDTPANRAAMPTAEHALWPKVEEVAATILFLASPQNKVTRGAVVPVYGAA